MEKGSLPIGAEAIRLTMQESVDASHHPVMNASDHKCNQITRPRRPGGVLEHGHAERLGISLTPGPGPRNPSPKSDSNILLQQSPSRQTSVVSTYSQDSLSLSMPPPVPAKDRPVISGPMPLLPRHARESISDCPPSFRSQKAIADEYRALPSSRSPEFSGLQTRRVSISSRSVDQPRTSGAIISTAQRIATSNSLPSASGIRKNAHFTSTISHRRTASDPSHRLLSTTVHGSSLHNPARQALSRTRQGRTAVQEFRLDVGPIYQAYALFTSALSKKFVDGVPRTSQMFLNAAKAKREALLTLLIEIRQSQAFEQAMKDAEVWESLLRSHCSKIGPGLDAEELERLFTAAQMLLESAWSSLGVLLNTCDNEVTRYNDGTQNASVQGPPSDDEEIIREIYTLLQTPPAASSDSHHSLTKNLITRIRRISGLSKVFKAGEDSGAADDSSSVSSFTLVETSPTKRTSNSTRHRRNGSDFALGTLGFSSDPYIMELNLSIRASRVIFSSVASQFAPPLSLRPATLTSVSRDETGTIILTNLSQLVRLLTDQADSFEPDHLALIDSFFLFFREFTTSVALFGLLRARYEEQPVHSLDRGKLAHWLRYQTSVKLHVVRMLATWLERHYIAETDKIVLGHIKHFIPTVARDRYIPNQAVTLLNLHLRSCMASKAGDRETAILRHFVQKGFTLTPEYGPTGFEQAVPVLSAAQEKLHALVDVLTFSDTAGGAEELARGLTCIESDMYHRYLPIDLVQCTEQCIHPLMAKMARWSTALVLFVSKCVVEHREPAARAKVFELFIEVAVICKAMRNYSSALSLLIALGNRRITRLGETLKLVSKHHMTMLSGIRDFFYLRSDAQAYRDELSSQVGPAVPLVSVVRSDVIRIRAIHDSVMDKYKPGNRDRPAAEVIDVQMYRNLRDVVRALESCYAPYKLPPDSFATHWLYSSIRPLQDTNLEEYEARLRKISEIIEPLPPLKHRGSWVQDEHWELGNWK